MKPLPTDGRILRFADLRPHEVYEASDEYVADGTGDDLREREIVALAIHEFPTVRWELSVEDRRRPPLPDEIEGMVERGELSEGEPVLAYVVLELAADGQVVSDWPMPDLGNALEFVDTADGPFAVWEELSSDNTEAQRAIKRRLAEPPRE